MVPLVNNYGVLGKHWGHSLYSMAFRKDGADAALEGLVAWTWRERRMVY